MTLKKRKSHPLPVMPGKLARYRNLNESSGYLPYGYILPPDAHKDNIIVVEDQGINNSGQEQ